MVIASLFLGRLSRGLYGATPDPPARSRSRCPRGCVSAPRRITVPRLVRRRLLVVLALGALALTVVSSASAASLSFDRPCYRSGQQALVTGLGYTPNGAVALGQDGRFLGTVNADSAGAFQLGVTPPLRFSGEKTYTFAAADTTNTAISAVTQVKVTALAVSVRPRGGSPASRRRVRARGFVGGRTLYAHARRGRRYKLDVRVGRLRGPCAKVSARPKLHRRDSPTGTYRVQFDARRRYSRRTPTRVVFRVRVFRVVRLRSASASAVAERWERIEPEGTGGVAERWTQVR